jgi:hypothetical protein
MPDISQIADAMHPPGHAPNITKHQKNNEKTPRA